MITRVSLKNFKLHASTEIEAAPITVFIGPNNSGKSSIFQALLSLRQAASIGGDVLYRPDRDRQHLESALIVDIGSFGDVLRHGGDEIQIGVKGFISPTRLGRLGKKLRVGFNLHIRDNRLVYHAGEIVSLLAEEEDSFIPGKAVDWEWSTPSQPATFGVRIDDVALHFIPTTGFNLIQFVGMTPPANFPKERLAGYNELLENLAGVPAQFFKSVRPVFPLRGFEEWGYSLPDSAATNLDRLGLRDRAEALASILAYDRGLERKLSEWLEGLLGINVEVKLLPPKRVTIRCKQSSVRNSDGLYLNEGTGANQLPFILIPIGLAPEHETILLCEPEAHLHPYGQSKLMKFLLKVQEDRKLQYFIETHSEHVLHSLLHAVAKGDLRKSELAIYYFENVNGEAKVRRLQANEQGQVEGGLPGFFDQSLAELTEYLEALKKT